MTKVSKNTFQPNNSNLLNKIKVFQANQNQETFMNVIEELQGENAFLLVPTSSPITGDNPKKDGQPLKKVLNYHFHLSLKWKENLFWVLLLLKLL